MNRRPRLLGFLASRRNIVGSVLGLGGLALFFSGIVGGPLGIAVTAALYAIGVLVVPPPERTMNVDLSNTLDFGSLANQLNGLIRSNAGYVAPDILQKVMTIRDSILGMLPSNGEAEAGDPNVYLIQQTALTYLPQALAAYRAIPRLIAEQRPVANGRTPHDVLLEQLELMESKLREVADDIARHDSDRLLVNGRFLADRFGTSSLTIGEGAAIPTATAAPASTPQPTSADAATSDRQRVH